MQQSHTHKHKLYCFVDETGQDTNGKFFLVSTFLADHQTKETLEPLLETIEQRTHKRTLKWSNTPFTVKEAFLAEIATVRELRQTLYYSVYAETKAYTQLTALSIAKAINAKVSGDYFVFIVIDGLTKKDTEKIRIELKKLKIRYKTIRGMRDEQSVFLRLADSVAGFVRDYTEQQPYAKKFFDQLEKRAALKEV